MKTDPISKPWTGKCQRCGKKTNASTMSWINTELICMDCDKAEQNHPLYKESKAKELAQVQKGNLNYEGIGFDHASLHIPLTLLCVINRRA